MSSNIQNNNAFRFKDHYFKIGSSVLGLGLVAAGAAFIGISAVYGGHTWTVYTGLTVIGAGAGLVSINAKFLAEVTKTALVYLLNKEEAEIAQSEKKFGRQEKPSTPHVVVTDSDSDRERSFTYRSGILEGIDEIIQCSSSDSEGPSAIEQELVKNLINFHQNDC